MPFINWIKEFFEDHRGGASYTRGSGAVVLGAVLYAWLNACVKTSSMVPLDANTMLILAAAMGIPAAKSAMGEKA